MASLQLSQRKRVFLLVVLGTLVSLGSGCDSGPKLNPVTGKVTINGQPLTSGTVIYHPDKAKNNSFGGECVGDINAQGEYTLQTNGKPGAPPGSYKVTVAVNGPTTPDNTHPSAASPINNSFSLVGTTPLEKEVVEKPAAGAYDLQVGP